MLHRAGRMDEALGEFAQALRLPMLRRAIAKAKAA